MKHMDSSNGAMLFMHGHTESLRSQHRTVCSAKHRLFPVHRRHRECRGVRAAACAKGAPNIARGTRFKAGVRRTFRLAASLAPLGMRLCLAGSIQSVQATTAEAIALLDYCGRKAEAVLTYLCRECGSLESPPR